MTMTTDRPTTGVRRTGAPRSSSNRRGNGGTDPNRGIAWRTALAATLLVFGAAASAQEIRVSGGECGQPVHLVAHDAPLSSVLKKLADSLHFKLTYQSERDPLISFDERLSVTELVRRLARDVNFSLEQAIDPSCRQARVARLSILPGRPDGTASKVAAKPAWQTPEFERIARQGLSDYLQSHGMEDKPLEELVVR